MRLWAPLADELGRGYWGRLCASNLLTKEQMARHLGVDANAIASTQAGFPLLERLLAHLQMDRDIWMRKHSLAPARSAIASWRLDVPPPLFSHPMFSQWRLRGERTARLCRDCVVNDLARLGFSYWRRVHQLPEVSWCVHHERPLGEVSRPNALDQSPQAVLAEAAEIRGERVDIPLASPPLRRYAAVLKRFLDEAQGLIPLHRAIGPIQRRAYALGEGRIGLHGPHITVLFFRGSPSIPAQPTPKDAWTATVRKPHALVRLTDSYALALAVMWERPDEAVKAVFDSAGWVPDSRQWDGRPHP